MRLPELLQSAGVVAWAREFGGTLRRVLGTRQAAGIAVGSIALTTGTTTIVKTPAAKPGREVIPVPRNASGHSANVVAPRIVEEGSFTLLHTAGDPGRVVTWLIV